MANFKFIFWFWLKQIANWLLSLEDFINIVLFAPLTTSWSLQKKRAYPWNMIKIFFAKAIAIDDSSNKHVDMAANKASPAFSIASNRLKCIKIGIIFNIF